MKNMIRSVVFMLFLPLIASINAFSITNETIEANNGKTCPTRDFIDSKENPLNNALKNKMEQSLSKTRTKAPGYTSKTSRNPLAIMYENYRSGKPIRIAQARIRAKYRY